jgi:radical SAM protein with 4Fe4S-binding SPASM domain
MAVGEMARMGRQIAKGLFWHTAPVEVGWDVTYRCNARCAYCTNWTTDHPVMPMKSVRKVVDRVARLGTFQMSLSGGEPLTRKDIVEIVRLIKASRMRCSIVSNGSLGRRELYRDLLGAGLDSLVFSLDGATKETHERFRHGTSFEKVIRSIQTCQELIAEHGYRTRIATNTVLTNANIDEIPKIAALVRGLGIKDFKFQPVWKQHFTTEHLLHQTGDDFNEVYGFPREKEELLRKAVELIKQVGASNLPDFTDRFVDFYLGTDRAREIPCYALRAFVAIDADGNVFPCGKVEEKIANILDDQWEEDPAGMFATERVGTLMRDLAAQRCGGCAAVVYMERNLMIRSLTNPRKLAQIVSRRVLR